MRPKDYRKMVEREVQNAALRQEQPKLESNATSSVMRQSLQTQSAIMNSDDAQIIENLVQDQEAESAVRAAAIARLGFGDDARVNLNQLIDILRDPNEAPNVRMQAILKLEVASFERVDFNEFRPDYLAALRSCLETEDDDLRYKVLDVLTSNKDTFAQDKLLDWLQHLDQSPISASTALQLLGNDIHAGIYPVAKQVLDNPPDHAARLEALRLLASDGESQEYFKELLHNRAEPVDVRRIAASAVKSLTPDQFKEQALAIVKDEDEDDSLRATMLAGIAHSSDFLDDDDLRASVQEVCDSTQSTYIRTISDKYLTRTSNPVLKQYNEIRKNRSR